MTTKNTCSLILIGVLTFLRLASLNATSSDNTVSIEMGTGVFLPAAYVTDFSCSVSSNGMMSVAFTVVGQPSRSYDVYRLANLGGDPLNARSAVWLHRCSSGQRCAFGSEPATCSFYVVQEVPSSGEADADVAVGRTFAVAAVSQSKAQQHSRKEVPPVADVAPEAKARFHQATEGFKVTLSCPR